MILSTKADDYVGKTSYKDANLNITNKSGKVITDKQWGGYGNDSVFDLERIQNDFGMGSMSGFMDNVPKLFDISMNSYGDIYRKNKKAEDISTGKTK